MPEPSVHVAARQPATETLLREPVPRLAPTVTSPALVTDVETGDVVLVTLPYEASAPALDAYRRALLAYPMESTMRSGGIRNASRVFGYSSRSPLLKRNGCRLCHGASEAPEAHRTIVDASGWLAGRLGGVVPERATKDLNLVRSMVLPEWIMHPDAWWTSGVVNRTSPLPYHRDRNNFAAWSAMVVVRRGVRGGHLHVPEYDMVVECRDGDVVWFNGNDLIHGVTPMTKVLRDGYRISAVYYPVAKMRHCLTYAEEIERGRLSRTAAEDDMMNQWRRHEGQADS